MYQVLDHQIEQIIIDSLLLTKDGVGIFDPEDRLVFCNLALETFLSIPVGEALHKTFSELCFICFSRKIGINVEAECFDTWIAAANKKRRHSDYRTFETDTVTGKYFIVTEQMVQNNYLYMYITDITEKKESEKRLKLMSQELEKLAATDYLTGIHNRRHFYETAKEEFNRSLRENIALTVLMLDLDKFKLINDTYGHNAGDIVLKTFTKTVSKLLRDYDTFARIGGEEFAILLPSTDAKIGAMIAERIRAAVAAMKIIFENDTVMITTSIGLLQHSDQINSFDHMMQIADEYLNQAKKNGRNIVKSD